MAFLALVELLIFIFFSYMLITQILIPFFKGTGFFPGFRFKLTFNELRETLDEKEKAEIDYVVAETKAQPKR